MLVTKNGMIHKCNTEERYRSFKDSGWIDYVPNEKEKEQKNVNKPKSKK